MNDITFFSVLVILLNNFVIAPPNLLDIVSEPVIFGQVDHFSITDQDNIKNHVKERHLKKNSKAAENEDLYGGTQFLESFKAYETDDIDNVENLMEGNLTDTQKIAKDVNEKDDMSINPLEDISKTNIIENTLPIFLLEPENAFVVKNRPATLRCKAAHSLQLSFKCSGSSQPPPSIHDKHVDPHTGIYVEEVTATIHRNLIDEYFGKGYFKCECHARSSQGVIRSKSATVSIAYIRKQFASPMSLRVESGSSAELKCEPPDGFPEPKIIWYKNNVEMVPSRDTEFRVTSDGSLRFQKVALQDMANYTCGAENIAGKRVSDSAVLIVYVNGGWTTWSAWKECKCAGKPTRGKKRTRSCSNPIPLNGGLPCSGPQLQKTGDCISCLEDSLPPNADMLGNVNKRVSGRWSTWSDWTSCSSECVQIRRRKCLIVPEEQLEDANSIILYDDINYENSRQLCSGKDFQTAECRGDHCNIDTEDFDWTLYLSLAFIIAICFAFGAVIICCTRNEIRSNTHLNATRIAALADNCHDIKKKELELHIEAIKYDYANPSHRSMPKDHSVSCLTFEHHYDVPNLSVDYTAPIDDLFADYEQDSSSQDIRFSTYDIIPKVNDSLFNEHFGEIGSDGGSLGLYNNEVLLHVPELAIEDDLSKTFFVKVLNDESSRISRRDAVPLFICSMATICIPQSQIFLKPLILKTPHCLVSPEKWNVKIICTNTELSNSNTSRQKVITLGEETINTPIFVQLEARHAFIMTEQLASFVIIAEPKPCIQKNQLSIKMKLIAFSQLTPNNDNYSLRIYVVKDFPNSKDVCMNVESKLGGTHMGQSDSFSFFLNNFNLNICLRVVKEGKEEVIEHCIPYEHIFNNNSVLHCEFNFKCSNIGYENLIFNVSFSQYNEDVTEKDVHQFRLPNQENILPRLDSTVSIDEQGNYILDTTNTYTRLPYMMKHLICATLDPPRSDGRDWRLLAKKLNSDRYLAYFATKTSPTEQILNLWECRTNSSYSSIAELMMVLKEINRQDILSVISEHIEPLWI